MGIRRFDFLLAAISGALLALSVPTFGHPALGWIALAPLLAALERGTLRRAMLLGITTGVIYFAGTVYWTVGVMVTYGGLPPVVAVPVSAALIGVLALFVAAFAIVQRRLLITYGSRALLAAPFVWTATELGRTYLFTGFPWVLLGYSQLPVTPVAQFASLFGVYGLSALLVAVSAAAVSSVRIQPDILSGGRLQPDLQNPAKAGSHSSNPAKAGSHMRFSRFIPLVATIGLVAGIAVWGSLRVGRAQLTQSGEPVRVGLLQGNVDQGEKWDQTRAASIFDDYLLKTRQAIGQGAAVVIWPESSIPFFFEEDRADAERVRAIARQARVPILLGSNQIERGTPNQYFNAAFMVGPDGETAGSYRKMHLVPFGEYVPLKSLLFFASRLVEAVSDFSPGDTPSLLPVGGHKVSVAICYEVVYPDLVRQGVRGGSELLVTITNDAWFGRSSAPYQHFEMAAMRAIEEGRYLVRAANTGISGIVDPYGRVVQQTPIFEPAVLVGEARFLQTSTLYSRIGDLFAYAAVVLTAVLLVQSWVWRQSTT